jgi:hypothetical protein
MFRGETRNTRKLIIQGIRTGTLPHRVPRGGERTVLRKERDAAQLVVGQIGDGRRNPGGTRECVVMEDDHLPVGGELQVKLDAVAGLARRLERQQAAVLPCVSPGFSTAHCGTPAGPGNRRR